MKTRRLATTIAALLLIAPVSALAATRQSSSQHTVKANPQGVTQTTVNWQIPLTAGHGFAQVTGSAQYQAQPGQREFQIEIDHLRSRAGQSLRVQVNAATVGWMKVSRAGIAQLTRNTDRAQKTPVIVHGSTVTVQTKAGVVVAFGKF